MAGGEGVVLLRGRVAMDVDIAKEMYVHWLSLPGEGMVLGLGCGGWGRQGDWELVSG